MKLTTRQVGNSPLIAQQQPFTTNGSLEGRMHSFTEGRLDGDDRKGFTKALRSGAIVYAVYSYATPIAWFDRDLGWIMPKAKYSPTTSKHQTQVAMALRGHQVWEGYASTEEDV